MRKIATYKNGNVLTTIYDDGTKRHLTMDDEFKFEFPECHDIMISERCDNGCPECYANCTKDGKFGELDGWNFFDTMRPYTEIAINLQSPLHPRLMPFLEAMKRRKIIVNATVNQNHYMEDSFGAFVDYLIKDGYITGLGISLTDPTQEGFIDAVKNYKNAVVHVIAGYTPIEDIKYLMGHGLKLLILGYKVKGRGADYYNKYPTYIRENIKLLADDIDTIRNGFKVVSFDNLAIAQLDIKNKISHDEWEMIYGGEEGTLTFFIDLVNGRFAKSSLSDVYYPIGDKTIDEMFEVVRNEGGF